MKIQFLHLICGETEQDFQFGRICFLSRKSLVYKTDHNYHYITCKHKRKSNTAKKPYNQTTNKQQSKTFCRYQQRLTKAQPKNLLKTCSKTRKTPNKHHNNNCQQFFYFIHHSIITFLFKSQLLYFKYNRYFYKVN